MSTRTNTLRAELAQAVASAKSITDRAEREKRALTESERKVVSEIVRGAERTKRDLEAAEQLTEKVRDLSGSAAAGSLYDAFRAAGWQPGKKAVVGPEHLKTATFTGDPGDIAPVRREGAALGFDRRYLADVFPSQPIGNATSVQVTRQASRTLPAPGDVQRALMATSPKAEVATVRELVTVNVGQLAARESAIPNALLAADANMRSTIDADLRLAVLEAKDDSITDAITAATPAASDQGSDLTSAIIYAAAQMAAAGYSGTVVALSPMDYADLALLRGDAEQFARRDPLADFRFVPTKSVANGAPLLIDPAAAGKRYEGNLSLQSFEENDGATNTSLIRLEQSFLFHVERPAAIRRITETPI